MPLAGASSQHDQYVTYNFRDAEVISTSFTICVDSGRAGYTAAIGGVFIAACCCSGSKGKLNGSAGVPDGIGGCGTGALVIGSGGSMPAARKDATNELSPRGVMVAGASVDVPPKACSPCRGAGIAGLGGGGVGGCGFAVAARS